MNFFFYKVLTVNVKYFLVVEFYTKEFKNVATRVKKLQWKDVIILRICSLFKGKGQYRVNFGKAIAELQFMSESCPAPPQDGPTLSQAGPSQSQAQQNNKANLFFKKGKMKNSRKKYESAIVKKDLRG